MIHRHPVLFLLLFSIFAGCQEASMVEESRLTMDTFVNIKVPSSAKEDIMDKSFSKIEAVDRLMNRYDDESECAFINRLNLGDKVKISPQTAFVLRKALELNSITGGAFDITVPPLAELWHSYRDKDRIPSKEEIEEALLRVGSKNILLDDKDLFSFAKDGVEIDLSGIAKGYAVDEAIKVLRENGVENALVDAGGDMYCLGDGPDKKGWRIGVRHPRKEAILGRLVLKDRAVATSGDYQRFFIIGGRRYSHIIDPRSGYPIGDATVSATVVAPDCITADGLATAVSVMGPLDGLALIEKLDGVEAVVVEKDGEGLKIDMTSGLKGIYESLQEE